MQPEQIKIAITLRDGSLVIMSFITNDHHGIVQEPTRGNINAIITKAQEVWSAPAKSWRIINDVTIPTDRYFRNAWTDKGLSIGVDIAKAKEIHKENLRTARASLLDQLDVSYMRADEAGNKKLKAEITAKKQALRDITDHPDFKKARTVAQIKAIKINLA